MEEQIGRLTQLANDLLDVSRMQAGKLALNKEIFDLDELVKKYFIIQYIISVHIHINIHTCIRYRKSKSFNYFILN